MKTFLILINNAPKMAVYHKALGDKLKEKGNKTIYAVTDKFAIENNNLDFANEHLYVFSEYFKQNENKSLNNTYKNINIWKTYFSDYDRNIVHYKLPVYGSSYYLSLFSNLINFFDEIIHREKVDYIIYENISNSFSYAAYEVGKVNNVGYRGYVGSRLPNRFELHTEEFGIKEEFKERYESFDLSALNDSDLNEVRTYLSKYEGSSMPSYHPKKSKLNADYSLIERYLNKEKFIQFFSALKNSFSKSKESKFNYQIQSPLSTYMTLFKRQLIKRFRTKIGGKYFEKINNQDKYFLYPLHMKPESSTSVLAKHYCNDLAVIQNIAFNLPFDCKLYVKEHFVNYGNVTLDFYKELKKIPNVKLISSNENSMDLIKGCLSLITLTSTMGLEALFLGKKVIVFGNVFYEVHPNCIKLSGFDNLFECLREIPGNLISGEELKNANERFVASYKSITYEGNVGYPIYEQDDLKRFVDPFINALEIYDNV